MPCPVLKPATLLRHVRYDFRRCCNAVSGPEVGCAATRLERVRPYPRPRLAPLPRSPRPSRSRFSYLPMHLLHHVCADLAGHNVPTCTRCALTCCMVRTGVTMLRVMKVTPFSPPPTHWYLSRCRAHCQQSQLENRVGGWIFISRLPRPLPSSALRLSFPGFAIWRLTSSLFRGSVAIRHRSSRSFACSAVSASCDE